MEVKTFYKTQRDLAAALNFIVDTYWNNQINEDELFKKISDLYINNSNKVTKGDDFTTVLKQQCGKRRLEVIEKVLISSGCLKK